MIKNIDKQLYFIAEIGQNHNGSISLAKEMVIAAKECGANAVKFQSFVPKKLLTALSYNGRIDGFGFENTKTIGEYLEKVKIDEKFHFEIKDYCDRSKIDFFSTPADIRSVKLLENVNVNCYKIASGDLTNYPVLEEIAKTGKQTILSTGASDIDEISDAIKFLNQKGCSNLILLHAVSLYPTEGHKANLNAIRELKDKFNLPVGFSDHTLGFHVALAAIAVGAVVIEKHFTIDKTLPGADQNISADVEELKKIVQYGNEIHASLNVKVKKITDAEKDIQKIIRKSIYSSRDLKMGDKLTINDLEFKRPDDGISAKEYENILGKKINKDLPVDSQISLNDLID